MQFKTQCLEKECRADTFLLFVYSLCQKYPDVNTARELASFRYICGTKCAIWQMSTCKVQRFVII